MASYLKRAPLASEVLCYLKCFRKNTGSVSGCILESLKKGIKRTIQSKKCKVDIDKKLKCMKCAENSNEAKLVVINQDLKPWTTCT